MKGAAKESLNIIGVVEGLHAFADYFNDFILQNDTAKAGESLAAQECEHF